MKEDLRIPTVAIAAEVLLESGEKLAGQVFLPLLASRHSGRPRPDEWINQPTGFFPFLPEGRPHAVVLNKDTVQFISMPLTPEVSLEEASTGFTSFVELRLGEIVLQGTLLIDMPAERTRVLDYLNGEELFIPVWGTDTYHLVRKRCITMVTEREEY